MSHNLTAKADVDIQAPASAVWEALVTPELIKQYLFGTETKTDWKVGSPITFSGSWEGKSYEDKGTIVDVQPNKLLHTTYFSNMSGKEDKPENYSNVYYRIEPAGKQTVLTIVQDNNADEKSRDHSQANWNMVLMSFKKVVEQ